MSDEKFILITGAGRGIGRAIALSQAKAGVTLFLNYLRDDASAEKVKQEAAQKGARVHLMPANMADADDIRGLFSELKKHTNRLDHLVHNAALGVFKPVTQLRVKDWDISLDVNAKALLLLTQEALPLMRSQGGKIVALSSLGASHYTPNYGAIGISKAALENLVRYLAVELASDHIQVNAVSGGLIDTDSLKMFPGFDQMKAEYLARVPGKRLGKPEDIAKVVSFLLSPDSDWITGQTLIADGGFSLL